jgi:cullin-associated NEDD8-dissociated protein 1
VQTQPATTPQSLVETLAIFSILIGRFPNFFSNYDLQPLTILTALLSHSRPVVRKRAITTIAQFIPVSQAQFFPKLLQTDILPNLVPSASIEKQRTTIQLLCAVVRQSTQQVSSALGEITPRIIASVQRDDEELRESCLQVGLLTFGWANY